MRAFWTVGFFVITAGVILLASYETLRLFRGGHPPDFGVAVGELSLVVVLGLGEILALLELRQIGEDRAFQSWLKAQEIWTEKTFREGRAKVFQRLHTRETVWTDADEEHARDVCRKMDEFAHLVPFLGLRRVLDVWDDPLAKGWLVLKGVVARERDSSGWSRKWMAFQDLGEKALEKMIHEHRDPR